VRTVRYLLSWYFWILFGFTGAAAILIEPVAILEGRNKIHDPMYAGVGLALEIASIAAAFAFVKAWWVLRRDALPARFWCISASLASLILPVGFPSMYLISHHPDYPEFWRTARFFAIPASIGIAGILFAFTDGARPLPSQGIKRSA
jgi:hypothetical protein